MRRQTLFTPLSITLMLTITSCCADVYDMIPLPGAGPNSSQSSGSYNDMIIENGGAQAVVTGLGTYEDVDYLSNGMWTMSMNLTSDSPYSYQYDSISLSTGGHTVTPWRLIAIFADDSAQTSDTVVNLLWGEHIDSTSLRIENFKGNLCVDVEFHPLGGIPMRNESTMRLNLGRVSAAVDTLDLTSLTFQSKRIVCE